MNPRRPTLYQLQSRWDDERAARRVRDLRLPVRPEISRLPLILALFAAFLAGLAAAGAA